MNTPERMRELAELAFADEDIKRLTKHVQRLEQWIVDELRSRGVGDRSITGILDALERVSEFTP